MTRSVVLLDGGMGQELLKRSTKPPSPLWSAQVLIDEPHLVEAVHADYIAAGAKVLTINSYTVTPQRLARDGNAAWFAQLQAAAVAAATRARAKSGRRDIRIAGCLPPLVASYRADLAPDEATCLAEYGRIVAATAEGVDFYLAETLPSVLEARSATLAARRSGKPVWTSMTIDDADGTKLRSGEPLIDAARAAAEAGAGAVLVNCSFPEAFAAAMRVLATVGLPFGGYANGFTSIAALQPGGTVSVLEARQDLDPETYGAHAMSWIEAGARIVGGCCEVGPAHIAELARQLTAKDIAIVADPA